MLPVRSSVPQVFLLGSLLFIVYVNHIPSVSSFLSILLYVTVTKLISSIKSLVDSSYLQEDLASFYSWCQDWKLTINFSKCCLLYTPRSYSFSPSSYTIGGKTIQAQSRNKGTWDCWSTVTIYDLLTLQQCVGKHIISSTRLEVLSQLPHQ